MACLPSRPTRCLACSPVFTGWVRAIFGPSTFLAPTNLPLARAPGRTASGPPTELLFSFSALITPTKSSPTRRPRCFPRVPSPFVSTPSAVGARSPRARISARSSLISTIFFTSETKRSTILAIPGRSSTSAPTPSTARKRKALPRLISWLPHRSGFASTDLRHVTVVLCCDPKAFTHTNPLDGMSEGGSFVWESEEEGEQAWERLPMWARTQIWEKHIRVFTLPGFQIARRATDRADLQLRMQGNAFLGAFFAVSPLLADFGIAKEQFHDVVHKQYVKKFGRLGDAVVKSNMEVMTQGFERVREIQVGELRAPDRSTLRGEALLPLVLDQGGESCRSGCRSPPNPTLQQERTPVTQVASFNAEFRAGFGYNQPASAYASVGVIAAASGDTASKYVARRETPLFIPENCTQCMECITVCPDTALPNCSQELETILRTAITQYVKDSRERVTMLRSLPEIEKRARERMRDAVANNSRTPLPQILHQVTDEFGGLAQEAKQQFFAILDKVPMAFQKTHAIFSTPERKHAGDGGIFSIFVSDLCKGCAACVTACGDHAALKMVLETEAVNAEHETGSAFLNLLPDTPQKYLGLYSEARPQDSKTATLRNMLMVRRNYDALVSGDGACAGCGEKSILRAIAAVTEAFMRPIYHLKADRLQSKAAE